jgi:acetolactate synthase-1/2/3 large subunit
VACPHEVVWCIAGDGGFQMTLHEMATAACEKIAVKVAIINNGFLGMVRQWQEMFYGKRYVGTPLFGPDFIKLAEAYGISGMRVTDKKQVASAIRKAMAHDGPYVLDFIVEPEENVYPMVPPGASIVECIEMPKPEAAETRR